jgi:hypothetical protein
VVDPVVAALLLAVPAFPYGCGFFGFPSRDEAVSFDRLYGQVAADGRSADGGAQLGSSTSGTCTGWPVALLGETREAARIRLCMSARGVASWTGSI